jgi:hypothetical protein
MAKRLKAACPANASQPVGVLSARGLAALTPALVYAKAASQAAARLW